MANRRTIAVIGAGPSGLTAIKQCLDYGHKVKCFEQTDDIGGLWRYRSNDMEGLPSVMRSTISNTSKELSSFSDYPAPDHFPNFLHNTTLLSYFESYADFFELRKYICFNHEVVSLNPAEDYETTGRWRVTCRNNGTEWDELYDGVMVCSGHFIYPRIPKFAGQSKFKGELVHTHSLKTVERFTNKNVVVVGFANSALDAAVELSLVAKQVYTSTRRGGWVFTRTSLGGWPRDYVLSSRIFNVIAGLLGKFWPTIVERCLNLFFDHELYGIKPKHRFTNQHPIVSDHIFSCLVSHRVKLCPNIKEFTERGVIFENNKYVDCDAVIFGTGYELEFPFIKDTRIFSCPDDRIQLYKNVFNLELEHPHTLAFIGLISPLGPIFPVSELQSRWFASLMKGSTKLPAREEMRRSIRKHNEAVFKTFYDSPRHTIEVKFVPYMDELAEMVGCKPDLWWIAATDPKLWYRIMFGPGVSYQYRLTGLHTWPGARDAILNVKDRVMSGMRAARKAIHPDRMSRPESVERRTEKETEKENGIEAKDGGN